MKRPHSRLPRMRAEGLVIHELPDEVLIYDQTTDQAHCLNHTAALVWHACNGRLAPAQIAGKLTKKLHVEVPEEMVLLALLDLERIHLLEPEETGPVSFAGLTRRQMVRALGLTAAVVLPAVTTIMAPTPAQASSCISPGQPCSPVKLCCTSCNPTTPAGPRCI